MLRGGRHLLQLRARQPFGLGQRGAQLLGANRLQQIGHGFGIERLQRVLVESGGEDDGRGRGQRGEMSRHFQPVDAGHAHVEQHDVGRQPVDHVDRLFAIAGFTRDIEFAGFREHGAQTLARRRFVIDDEDAQAHAARDGRAVNGKRSVTMYSSSKRPDFTVARSPYIRSSRSLMLASARRLPSRTVRFGERHRVADDNSDHALVEFAR